MTLAQKLLVSILLLISFTLGILTLVFHTQILAAMLPISDTLRSWPAGWLIIFTVCFLSAFPPMIGYSTSVTLAGFIYGFPNGWFIIAAATVIGSTSAFLACRHLFRDFTRKVVATDRRFEALSLTLKHDGIKLLCMIRFCPLPYSISNGAVSTFPTVTPLAFAFATAIATPKLMIHVWIGQRLAILAAAEQKMDGKTKALNYCSIAGGVILGLLTGWIIYKRTLKRAAQLEVEERARVGAEEEGLLVVPDEVFEDLREEVEQDLGILMGDETSDDDLEGDEEAPVLARRGRSIGLVDQHSEDGGAKKKASPRLI
jgi:uncharacterized membrane protein YdjX (TVP38/TMEM64 family)